MKNYTIIRGKVIRGQSRGKNLGFPTANIKLHKKIEQGIYISETKLTNKDYPSITFIGNAKTFQETEVKAENYILNFNKNIYGKFISIKLLQRLRANQMFKNKQELVKQMKKDLEETKSFFKTSDL